MPEPDENQGAERAVREVTGTDKVNGEDFLPPDLARQLREAKERLEKEKKGKPIP
jgi:hypothetical protein